MSENFLEDINNLLNTGEIPNLFPKDEKDAICDEVSDKANKAGMGANRDSVYAYFVKECRAKLHIVLTFSPVGVKFRERVRQFPSIVNCCTIDWYLGWPEEALKSVAEREFNAVATELNIGNIVTKLAEATCNLHSTVKATSDIYFEELRRRTYTTPTSYLDLV
jgi:dynein heavy chain